MRIAVFLATLLLGYATDAQAAGGPFGAKAMREAFSTREVDRSLLLPKGWLELSLGFDYKLGMGAWGEDGSRQAWESARWHYMTEHVGLRYGLGPRVELWADMPIHQARLVNEELETDIKDWSFGDPRFGAKFNLISREVPRTSFVLELGYKAPAAKESPANYIGGPNNVTGFVFTTGTPDLSVGLGAKQQVGPVGFTAHMAYVHRFSGVVQYLVELENNQFLGRIKPGDQVKADLYVGVELGPVWLHAGGQFEWHDVTRIGISSQGVNPNHHTDVVAESDGTSFDVKPGVTLNLSRGVDVHAYANLPLVGEDLQFFPIEDLHPTLGPTFGGAVELRY